MSKNKCDEDGNVICNVCNGTAYEDNVMERYTNYVSKENLRKHGVHFCGHCGFSGKVDWIANARGESRLTDPDIEYLHDSITPFVALYSFTDYSPLEEIINPNHADERNEVRENIFKHLNNEISGNANPGHTFRLNRERFPTTQDLIYFNPDYIDDLQIDGELWHYLDSLRSISAARLVLEIISFYLDGMRVLPTKGMDKVINVVCEFFDNPDEPIYLLIDEQVRSELNYAGENADCCARDIGLNTFDDIVRLVKYAEKRTGYVATRKELEDKGVLFFD